MLNLNKNEMQKVYELSTKMWNARRQNVSIRENLIQALREELPEKEDCESAVESLRAGSAMLDSNLEKLDTRSMSSVLEEIVDRSISELDTQTQYQWLSGLLNTCLQAAKDNLGGTNYVFVPVENAAEEDVAALKTQLIELVEAFGLAMIENLGGGRCDERLFLH